MWLKHIGPFYRQTQVGRIEYLYFHPVDLQIITFVSRLAGWLVGLLA